MQWEIRTAGLNKLPLILKNTHAVTARENPNDRAMKVSCVVLAAVPTLFVSPKTVPANAGTDASS